MGKQEESHSVVAAGEKKSRVVGCHSHFVPVEESKSSSLESLNFLSIKEGIVEGETMKMETGTLPNNSTVGTCCSITNNGEMKEGCLKGPLGHEEKLDLLQEGNGFKQKSTLGFHKEASEPEDRKGFLKESSSSLKGEDSVCLNNLEGEESMELSEALALSKPLDLKKAMAFSEGFEISVKLSTSDPQDQQESLFEVRGAASFADDTAALDKGGPPDEKLTASSAGENLSMKSAVDEIKREESACREKNCGVNGDSREVSTNCQQPSLDKINPEMQHSKLEAQDGCKSISYEDHVVVSPQDENTHQKLMSGSLLGLWKKRGRPPNRVKNMIIQQALGSDCPDMDSVPRSQAASARCEESLASQRVKRRRTQRPIVHMSYSTSDEDSDSGLGDDDEEEENREVDEEEMYGCSQCNYSWDGCSTCRSGKAAATRSKARWDPSNAHHQDVPSAPIYYPTYEEFQNPMEFLSKIKPEAEKYGICMIVPPPGWDPPLPPACLNDSFSFSVKKQITDSLCIRPLRTEDNSNPPSACQSQGTSRMTSSSAGQVDEFGFDVLDEPISMKSFKSYAEWATAMHFADGGKEKMPELSVSDIEGEFWRIVEDGSIPVDVLYGSDLDTGELGSGFPVSKGYPHPNTGDPLTCEKEGTASVSNHGEQYRVHPWNINSWPQSQNSVLRHIIGDELITGVMVPWLYVGSCMSAFCWHVEDHFLYSVNYLHAGAKKIWYGVPSAAATDFEAAMKDALPHLFEADPNLLHRLVTHMSPRELMRRGVPVHRVEHKPGSFVITFPNAYHGGFNCGWNFAEAVNFAPPDWLPHGTDATLMYRMQARSTTFSNDALLVTLVGGAIARYNKNTDSGQKCGPYITDRSLDDKAVMYALGELVLRIEVEDHQQKIAGLCGIAQVTRMHGNLCAKDDQGLHTNTFDVDCDVCKADLYLSSVISRQAPGRAVCPEHTSYLPEPRIMLVRYTIRELQSMTSEAVSILSQSREYIQAAQIRSKSLTPSKVILHGLFKGSAASGPPAESNRSVLGKRKTCGTTIGDLASKRTKAHGSVLCGLQSPTLHRFMASNVELLEQQSGGAYPGIASRPASQNTWSSLHLHTLPMVSLSSFAPLMHQPGLIPCTSSSTTAGHMLPSMGLPFLPSLQLPAAENMKSMLPFQFPSVMGQSPWPQGTESPHVTQLVPPIPSVLQHVGPISTQIAHPISDLEDKHVQVQTGTTPRGLIETAGPLISISPAYIGKVAGNSLSGGGSSPSGVANVIDVSLCDTPDAGSPLISDSVHIPAKGVGINKQYREAEPGVVEPPRGIGRSIPSQAKPRSTSCVQVPSVFFSAQEDCGLLHDGSNEDTPLPGCQRIRGLMIGGAAQVVEGKGEQSVERDKTNDCANGHNLGSVCVQATSVAMSDSGKDARLLVPT